MTVPRQQAARKKGDDREGHDQGCDDCCENGNGQGPDEVPGAFWQRDQWKECKDQRRRASQHRDIDFRHAGNRGLSSGHAVSQMAGNIFRHHDRVIDQKPQGDNKAGDRELVHCVAKLAHPEHADRQR